MNPGVFLDKSGGASNSYLVYDDGQKIAFKDLNNAKIILKKQIKGKITHQEPDVLHMVFFSSLAFSTLNWPQKIKYYLNTISLMY